MKVQNYALAALAALCFAYTSIAADEANKQDQTDETKDFVLFKDMHDAEKLEDLFEHAGEITAMQELKVGRLFYIETTNGHHVVSDNGRYVFTGELADLWNKTYIESAEQAKLSHRIPLTRLNLKYDEDLGAFSVGNQSLPLQAIVFLDPTTDASSLIIEKVMEYEREVHIKFIMLPGIGGHAAIEASRGIICNGSRNDKLESILSKDFSLLTEGLNETCGGEEIMFANALRGVFNIEGLPFLVRVDGKTGLGTPANMLAWLLEK